MRLLVGVYGFVLALWAPPTLAKTQCSCPTVDAVGEGNSSCSVAEYKKRCTIDFNQFGQAAEQRAWASLERTKPPGEFKPYFTAPGPGGAGQVMRDLGAKSPDLIAATAVLYMTVPVTAQKDGRQLLDYSEQDLRDLVAFASANGPLFRDVFGRQAGSAEPTPGTWNDNIKYVRASGCMEVLLPRGLNVMLKMEWSTVAEKPRCGK